MNGEDATSAGVTGAAACTRAGAGTDEDVNTYTGAISCAAGTLAANNYSFGTGTPADFTINKRTAHVVVTVADKVYDRTTSADVLTAILTNRRTGEGETEVDFDGTPAAEFATNSAGVNKPVNITGITGISGTKACELRLRDRPGDGRHQPEAVDASFTAADKVYNGVTAATVTSRSVDAADVINPDVVTLVGGSANFNNPNVGSGKPVTLTGASLTNPNYTIGTLATDTANITERNVTGSFTAADKDFDGTTAAQITGRSLINAVPGDAVSLDRRHRDLQQPGSRQRQDRHRAPASRSAARTRATTASPGISTTTADIQRDPGGNTPPPKDVKKDAEKALGGKSRSSRST